MVGIQQLNAVGESFNVNSPHTDVHVPLAGGISMDCEDNVKPPKSEIIQCLSGDLSLPSPLLSGETTPKPRGRRPCFRSCFLTSKEYGFLLMPEFLGLAVSFLLLASGCSLPFIYLVPYGLDVGLGHQHAAFLMSILGVVDIVGNITFGWLTDRRYVDHMQHHHVPPTGYKVDLHPFCPCARFLKPRRLSCYIFSVAMEGLCCLFVPLLRSFPLLVPFAVLYGYFDGAYVALIPVVTSDLVGTQYLSSALGVVYFLHAIPYLICPPIGGEFLKHNLRQIAKGQVSESIAD